MVGSGRGYAKTTPQIREDHPELETKGIIIPNHRSGIYGTNSNAIHDPPSIESDPPKNDRIPMLLGWPRKVRAIMIVDY